MDTETSLKQEVRYVEPTARVYDTSHSEPLKAARWPIVHLLVWVAAFGLFVSLPWSLEGKALAALHGLCAQQPDHSFYYGDARLPFDARMTGIYGGFITTAGLMAARGRWRAAGVPPLSIVVTMVVSVALMGFDGMNSTLRDFGMWHLYEPHNALRLATGLGTGCALAIFIWLMVQQLGFASPARLRRPSIAKPRELIVMAAASGMFAAFVLTGWELLRVPLTLVLMASALLVVTCLSLAFVLLLTRAEGRAYSTSDLARPATVSLIIAIALIAAMSGGRFALEAWLGVPAAVGGV